MERGIEEDRQRGRKEEKGTGKGNWTPMWINLATPLHLNTKCCVPTITGDTKVYLYVHYVDDDAF
jgi:hypothetical protein